MKIIEGVEFPDGVVELVETVVNKAHLVAGKECVFKADGQIRAAVEGATRTTKGNGVFLMIAPREHGATIIKRKAYSSGRMRFELTENSIAEVLRDLPTWYKNVKASLDESGRSAASKSDKKNPAWTRDELILTLEFYFRVPPWKVNGNHPEILKLSEELKHLSAFTDPPDAVRYRNSNGTYMKLMNFQSLDPTRGGRGLKSASRGDREVWDEFEDRRDELTKAAAAIRAVISNPKLIQEAQEVDGPDTDDITEAPEGRVLTRLHRVRERNAKLAKRKKDHVFKKTGALRCEACQFDFVARYGQDARNCIECHHIMPLSQLPEHTKTTLDDLALVCANCHRVIHKRKQWLTIAELRKLLQQSGTVSNEQAAVIPE
ncbi:HNH endonuclease [Granulicella mallensis]|uniref:Putative HNH restriction endonuclease n=1 Tax=Granulicella mallensis TaxID=940614 RepID=A0A7W7ZU39_9BACT|nr:HNH endonuclease [Granulicella mallensis]MBB5066158.1 putative HNH restriction endonuclease [Granulicella mallensis]